MATHCTIFAWKSLWMGEPDTTVHGVAKSQTLLNAHYCYYCYYLPGKSGGSGEQITDRINYFLCLQMYPPLFFSCLTKSSHLDPSESSRIVNTRSDLKFQLSSKIVRLHIVALCIVVIPHFEDNVTFKCVSLPKNRNN